MGKQIIRRAINYLGWDIINYPGRPAIDLPRDASPQDLIILKIIAPFTMTSMARQMSLIQAVRYIARQKIPGAMVECGVWRGGSSMAIALTLLQEKDTSRELYLFDTFEGMTPPTDKDKSWDNTPAERILQVNAQLWCVAGLDEVQKNMAATTYPAERVHFVKGDVRMTIPAPTGPIALLRLDTDFYDSTKHELTHLFPSLVEGGIMMIDDYGHWQGSRQAVDEYFAGQPQRPYLHRVDFSGRSMVKS